MAGAMTANNDAKLDFLNNPEVMELCTGIGTLDLTQLKTFLQIEGLNTEGDVYELRQRLFLFEARQIAQRDDVLWDQMQDEDHAGENFEDFLIRLKMKRMNLENGQDGASAESDPSQSSMSNDGERLPSNKDELEYDQTERRFLKEKEYSEAKVPLKKRMNVMKPSKNIKKKANSQSHFKQSLSTNGKITSKSKGHRRSFNEELSLAEYLRDEVALEYARTKEKIEEGRMSDSGSGDEVEDNVEYRLKCMDLLKTWNLQFHGFKGSAAAEFLGYLKDFRKFAKISDKMILEMLPTILDCNTRIWYRSKKFTKWSKFEKAFNGEFVAGHGKATYLPPPSVHFHTSFMPHMYQSTVPQPPIPPNMVPLHHLSHFITQRK